MQCGCYHAMSLQSVCRSNIQINKITLYIRYPNVCSSIFTKANLHSASVCVVAKLYLNNNLLYFPTLVLSCPRI